MDDVEELGGELYIKGRVVGLIRKIVHNAT